MSDLIKYIQADLKKENIDGVVITKSDPFLSGYYPPYKERLKEVSSFSGSDGIALILKEKAFLFVDSRYTEQAKQQTDFIVYEVPRDTRLSLWLKENMQDKKIIFDSVVHSYAWYEEMKSILKECNISLEPAANELINKWFKPVNFEQEVFDYSLVYAGKTTNEKLADISAVLSDKNLDAYIVLSPENTSWILNKRDSKKSEYPVLFKRMCIFKNGDFSVFDEELPDLKGLKIGIDYHKASVDIVLSLLKTGAKLKNISDFVDDMKAKKNAVEVKNIKEACLFESKVICSFLAYVEKNKDTITEIDCDKKLKELRKESLLYFHDSFQTIAASGVHAAFAHYSATEESYSFVRENPLLLIDTGGHYLNGTTDMTRTIVISEPSKLMKKRYTEVLKGHIAVSLGQIKNGESTAKLDEVAHAFLRADNVDFYHATGHGIGMMLGVHEYPPAIYGRDNKGLQESMVFSNEPAYYDVDEKFGIRLENMLLSVKDKQDSLIFEDLLFIPFDYRAIEFELLTKTEIKWLKDYHLMVEKKVFPLLSDTEKEILKPFVDAFLKG